MKYIRYLLLVRQKYKNGMLYYGTFPGKRKVLQDYDKTVKKEQESDTKQTVRISGLYK